MAGIFKTIASYQYTSEAQIIRGRLESEGIEVFLQDAVTIDTDPLVSNAIGGVKLKVRTEDVVRAIYILNTINQYATDNDGKSIDCPMCESNEVHLYSTINSFKAFIAFLVGVLTGTLPFHTRYMLRCDQCHHEFSRNAA